MIFDIKDRLIVPHSFYDKREFTSDEMYFSSDEDFEVVTISYYTKQILDIFVIKDSVVINKFKIKYNKYELPENQENIFKIDLNHKKLEEVDLSKNIDHEFLDYVSLLLNCIFKILKKTTINTYKELSDKLWYKFDKTNEVSYRRKLLSILFMISIFSKTENLDLCQVVFDNKFNEFKIVR